MWNWFLTWWVGDDPVPTKLKKLKFSILNGRNLYIVNERGDAVQVGLLNTPYWFDKWLQNQSITEEEVYGK